MSMTEPQNRLISHSVIAISSLSVLIPPVGADVLPLRNDMSKEYLGNERRNENPSAFKVTLRQFPPKKFCLFNKPRYADLGPSFRCSKHNGQENGVNNAVRSPLPIRRLLPVCDNRTCLPTFAFAFD